MQCLCTQDFVLATDASDHGIGGCLFQMDAAGNLRPVAFIVKKLNKAPYNYLTTEKQLLATGFCLEKYEHYLIGRKFYKLTAILAMKNKKILQGKMFRWVNTFSKFDYGIQHLKGKLNVVPDALSRIPNEEFNKWAENLFMKRRA